jgi:hypothetical protein
VSAARLVKRAPELLRCNGTRKERGNCRILDCEVCCFWISRRGVENLLRVACLPRPTQKEEEEMRGDEEIHVQSLPEPTRLNQKFETLQKIILLRGASQSALYLHGAPCVYCNLLSPP